MQSFKKEMCFAFHGNLGNSKSIGTNNLIKEFAEIVTSPDDILKKYEIEQAYVFGSYARGDATQKSDVDIMIKKGNIFRVF